MSDNGCSHIKLEELGQSGFWSIHFVIFSKHEEQNIPGGKWNEGVLLAWIRPFHGKAPCSLTPFPQSLVNFLKRFHSSHLDSDLKLLQINLWQRNPLNMLWFSYGKLGQIGWGIMSFVIVKKIQVIKRGAFLEGLPKTKQQKVKLSTPTAIS